MRWLTGLLLCTLSTCATAAEPPSTTLDAIVKDALKAWEVPGVAVAVVRNGEVVYLKGHGVRELGKTAPVTPDTLFPIASCTKGFTTAALAALVDDGVMAWDDPVRKHLDCFRLSDPLIDAAVTLRDLVSHRTGVRNHDLLWYKSPLSVEERVRRLAFLPVESPFRGSFHYQSTMFTAAGLAAGSTAKKPWAELIRQRLLKPLDMSATVLTTPEALKAEDHATPHKPDGRGELGPVAWYPIEEPDPAGSIASSARDLAKWVSFHLANGTCGGRRLVSARNLRETRTPQNILPLEGLPRENNPEATQMSYGMGWIVSDYRAYATVGHGGAIDGFRAHIQLLPDDGLAVVLLNNRHQTSMNLALCNNLIDELLGLPRRDWNRYFLDREKKRQQEAQSRFRERDQQRHHGARPSREAAAYTGRYHHDAYGDVEVTMERGGLVWKYHGIRCNLEHYHYDTFFLDLPELDYPMLTFSLNREGELVTMKVQEPLTTTFIKVKK